MFRVRGLTFGYVGGPLVLHGLDLDIPHGGRVALIGPSGAGKSTLLMHLAALLPEPLPLRQAAVAIDGIPATADAAPRLRGLIGVVFQDPDDQFLEPTVGEDVAFTLRHQGTPEAEVRRRVADALAAVGLAGLESRLPEALSAGERKRACLAAVLVNRPAALLLDEPTANLDQRQRRSLFGLLEAIPGTLLLATHDLEFAGALCGRCVLLDGGRIVADGRSAAILGDAALLGRHGLGPDFGLPAPRG